MRNLKKGESLDIKTAFRARQLATRLYDVTDGEGYSKIFRCQTVNDGKVLVTCEESFKINAVHTHITTFRKGSRAETPCL